MKALPQRFYSLDGLRGLAALAVVVVHWPAFFYYQEKQFPQSSPQLPLFKLLSPVYENGWRAVDLFFCLSGFIFFWLYSEKIRSRAVSIGEFSILRFSRLYPLHLVTLLLVALGQIFMIRSFGSWFVVGNNDLIHFIGQLFFASGWWGISEISFNGPIWSVSVEILLYALFFVVCRIGCVRWWHLVVFVLAGEFWVIHHANSLMIARGVLSFFLGGLAFRLFMRVVRSPQPRQISNLLKVSTLILWVLIPLDVEKHYLNAGFEALFGPGTTPISGLLGRGWSRLTQGLYELVLFPLTVLTLALWESQRGTLGKRVAVLGDLSYSTYLLHFPLQILFMIVTAWLGVSLAFFSSPVALLLFFVVLGAISLASYHFLERPAQSFLRSRLLSPRPRKGRP